MTQIKNARQTLLAQVEGMLDLTRVTINAAAIAALQPDFSTFSVAQARLPFTAATPRDAIIYILAQTALQYRFWDGFAENYRRYAVEDKVGSTAMVAGFDRAWGSRCEPGPAIVECAFAGYSRSRNMAGDVLTPHFGDIPDPVSRAGILAEVLLAPHLERLVGDLDKAFRAGHAGVDEAMLVSTAFPRAYGDEFIKKSMLAVGLMVAEYRRAGVVCEESLLAYADYQVPAVMRHLGILEYSPELAAKVDGRQHLPEGGPDEVAIRAATIVGCEQFAKHHGVTAAETDWFFWLKRKEPQQPFHLTDTTAY